MIDDKLLQSFISDIEWMKVTSLSPRANSAAQDPFAEVMAKAVKILEEDQSQGKLPLSADLLNTWLNPGSSRGSSVTMDDLDRLFPELANLSSLLGSK
ncbi:MAG: hypothetical protein FWG02_08660 [Holophagaceae bacterium]|nr:hypothetical protein [Holophagaceae bacterium]